MVKSALSFWTNQDPDIKATALEGEDLAQVLNRVAHLLRLELVGEGYLDRDSPKYAEKYVQTLLRLELNDICLIKDYIKIFKEYYYNIYGKIGNENMYLNLFYSKMPEPWSSNLIREYPEPEVDTLGKRINFLREKLSDWCHQAYLMRKTKRIRKQNTLCLYGSYIYPSNFASIILFYFDILFCKSLLFNKGISTLLVVLSISKALSLRLNP